MFFDFLRKPKKQVKTDTKDKTTFLIDTFMELCEKSNYGENLNVLTAEEQVFYINNELEQEVNNGGFSQYLSNSSGNYAHRVVDCLHTIGAYKTAEICKTALNAFGRPIPQDREERFDFLDEYETDAVAEILNKCDERFYKYEDDLETLNYNYVINNREKFL